MGLCNAVDIAVFWVLTSNSFRLLASLADRGRGLDVLTPVGTAFFVVVALRFPIVPVVLVLQGVYDGHLKHRIRMQYYSNW